MKATLLALLLLAGSGVYAQENATAQLVASELSKARVVRGKFIQVRQIAGVSGGLRSQGEYIFWRDHGIYLGTQLPFASAVTYRTDKTLRWPGENMPPQDVKSTADKHLRRILMAVFSFEMAQLERDFEQQWQFDTTGWTLQLTPKQSMTARFLKHISLRGDKHIESVDVHHANGEVVNLEFQDSASESSLDANSCTTYFAYSDLECEQFVDAANP